MQYCPNQQKLVSYQQLVFEKDCISRAILQYFLAKKILKNIVDMKSLTLSINRNYSAGRLRQGSNTHT